MTTETSFTFDFEMSYAENSEGEEETAPFLDVNLERSQQLNNQQAEMQEQIWLREQKKALIWI